MTREREAWREIQSERDALLEEKHRWATVRPSPLVGSGRRCSVKELRRHVVYQADDFADDRADEEEAVARSDLDSELRSRLEHELGQAEAAVLRLRAELGYSLTNHLTGTSTRLEKIARVRAAGPDERERRRVECAPSTLSGSVKEGSRPSCGFGLQEMTDAKKQFEEQVKHSEHESVQLKQLLVKFRCQKKVLVTELRNMKAQTEGQVTVAMAEASEARMVNRRLKTQNELLLTQIRTLAADARDAERKLAEQQQEFARLHSRYPEDDVAPLQEAVATTELTEATDEDDVPVRETTDDASTVPYTLTSAQIALLNGQALSPAAPVTLSAVSSERLKHDSHLTRAVSGGDDEPVFEGFSEPQFAFNPHRARLVAFLRAKDPSLLPEVEEMLRSYSGVESSLFDSLELKYRLMALTE